MKTNPPGKTLQHLVLAFAAFTAVSLSSSAFAGPITVIDADIGAGAYNFSVLGGAGPAANSLANYSTANPTGPGLIDSNNLANVDQGGISNLAGGGGASFASLILEFNFATSSFRPISLTLTSNTVDFTGNATYTYSYSYNNVSYVTFATSTPAVFGGLGTETISLAGLPDNVYVQIAASAPINFSANAAQFGRSADDNSATALSYSFSMAAVPEPSTYALLGIGLAILSSSSSRRLLAAGRGKVLTARKAS